MEISGIHKVYFIGIGGIGMSALARYFNALGKTVAGYDRTFSALTGELENEHIAIHYNDDVALIPSEFTGLESKNDVLVVYTPAVPTQHLELNYFIYNGFQVLKRSQVLGLLTKSNISIAIAGTHGKTTTSTCVAHILKSNLGCNAFLGGISKNYNSNLLLDPESNLVVVEADEFDRSFLTLFPHIAVVTSTDADHLDIYKNHAEVLNAFSDFIQLIGEGGKLIIKKGLEKNFSVPSGVEKFTYSIDEDADFCISNLHIVNGLYHFDLHTPVGELQNVILGLPGLYNVENAVAAMAAALLAGAGLEGIKASLATFAGVKRRFDIRFRNEEIVYIDDYAHHPEEIKACLRSARDLFKGKHITGIFQPHLFSRTQDFYREFAMSLGNLDRLVLLDIYPAREKPVPGITSKLILDYVKCVDKHLMDKNMVVDFLKSQPCEVVISMGAGDIDSLVPEIEKWLQNEK